MRSSDDAKATPLRGWLRPELVHSWTEFLVVAALLLAIPVRSSTLGALNGSSSHFVQLLLTDRHMLWSIFWEASELAIFFVYLHLRGWRPADFRMGPGWRTSGQGAGLLLLAWGGAVATLLVTVSIGYHLQTGHRTFLSFLFSISPKIKLGSHAVHLSWLTMLPAMIVNAFLEELIFMGYIFNQFAARRGPVTALVVTVFLRLACHTYQDPFHLAGIGVFFIILAVGYMRLRKLWPLIFGHALLDIFSCSAVKLISG